MKKFITYSFLTLILFVTPACNNSEDNQANNEKLDKVAIGLTCEMSGSRAAANLQGMLFDSSTEIGVYVQKTDGATDYGYNNLQCAIEHKLSGIDSLLQSRQMYFPLGNDYFDVDIRAYAPYDGRYGRIQSYDFDIQTDQSTSTGYLNSDLLYGLPTAGNPVHHVITHDPTKKTQNVNLTFHHLLSKITLTLQPVAPLTAEALVGAQVTLKQVATKVPFNLVDGSLGTASTPADVLIASVASADETTVSGLIPPQTISSGDTFIVVTLSDGQVYEYAIPASGDQTFNGGKNYQYNMKFGANQMTVTMSVADWVDITGQYTL